MTTKDYIYSIGILMTIIFSAYNLYITTQNRRNSLREHLYKEQISIFQNIFRKINEINIEFDLLLNIHSRINDNNYGEKVKELGELIFANEFILPNILIPNLTELIKHSEGFYSKSLSTEDWNERLNAYKEYYDHYYKLIETSKEFYGIDNLSIENNKLHTENTIINTRTLRSVIEKTVEVAIH